MTQSYLEVTFRKGRPLAAYYYLPRRPDEKSVETRAAGHGLLVDYSAHGKAIGIEITAPERVSVDVLNDVLKAFGENAVAASDLAPLHAA